MKLSISSSFFADEPPAQMLKTIAEHGFRHVEIANEHSSAILAHGGADNKAVELRKIATEYGVEMMQGHLAFRETDIADPGQLSLKKHLDLWKAELELFARLGVKAAVLHPGGVKGIQQGIDPAKTEEIRQKTLAELSGFIKGEDIQIALENYLIFKTMLFSDELLKVIASAGCGNLGICLDFGHLHLSKGESPVGFIRNCGDKLIALHINDNHGELDEHLFPYNGTVDWAPVSGELREINYGGLYNFEVVAEGRGRPKAIRLLKLDYALKLGEMIFSGRV